MNITLSFTTRLTMIAVISFIVFITALLIAVYELGKKHGIKIAQETTEKISINAKNKNNSKHLSERKN